MDNLLGFVLELYRLAQDTPPSEFHELALNMLTAVLPFRSATWSDATVNGERVEIATVQLHNEPAEVRTQFAAFNRQHIRRVMLAARQPGRADVLNDVCAYYNRPEEGAMRVYLKRYAHERNILITDLSQWISLYRPAGDPPFSERDVAVINGLLPHLVEALGINRALVLGDLHSAGTAAPARARALVDRRGNFLHCGKCFLELLRLQWRDWSEPVAPPSLLAKLSSGRSASIADGAVEISARELGSALLLTARRVSPLARLSPRELQIAQQFGLGKSYKMIAIETRLAPATVRNVLQKTYRKLAIDNKASLVRLLEINSE
ncbi:MAG: helix-turn-helix transcriptional regulator [Gammaproteobacteria bacterium]